jgi:hypothetical protein
MGFWRTSDTLLLSDPTDNYDKVKPNHGDSRQQTEEATATKTPSYNTQARKKRGNQTNHSE